MKKDALSLYEQESSQKTVSLISIPTDLGSDARGLAETPHYLIEHGLEAMLTAIGAELSESVSIPCPPAPVALVGQLKNLDAVATVAQHAAEAVAGAVARGETALALGGDHSSAIGTIAGASRAHKNLHKKMGLIWIDAHPDVHTPETTVSHNLHNMPAALAMGQGHSLLLGERSALAPEQVLFIGLKDFDKTEIDFLRRESSPHFTMLDIVRNGLAPVFNAIDSLQAQVDTVWVSMDMDSIDKEFAPGVAMPCTDGFTRREALALAQYIGKTGNISGLDVVEMLPSNDIDGRTAALAIELIARFLGGEYSWYRQYMDTYEKLSLNRVQHKRT